mmetsp:Transcript_50014/g.88094  ORF Transcript_50014/g.88094 Transcript_50014/m.88094 type:complete len:609 (-) Transcript_50014:39-1865(-)
MMQVPEMTLERIGNSREENKLEPVKEANLAARARSQQDMRKPRVIGQNPQLLQNSATVTAIAVSFVPTMIAIGILGLLVIIWMVHTCIQAMFKSIPFLSSLLMFALLAVFCNTMLPLISAALYVLNACGTLVLVSAAMAILVLMFTPVILMMPGRALHSEVGEYVFGPGEEKLQRKVESNKQKLSLLYLLIFVFQVASGVSIFLVAETAEGYAKIVERKELTPLEKLARQIVSTLGFTTAHEAPVPIEQQYFAGSIEITFLYAILAWASLSMIYERMFPYRSFAADFPSAVFNQAFMGGSRRFDRGNLLQNRLSGMKAAIDAMSGEARPSEQEVKDFFGYVSSALKDVKSDVLEQNVGITDQVTEVTAAIDSQSFGKLLHYFLWLVYAVGMVIYSIDLGVKLGNALFEYHDHLLAWLWVFIGFSALFFLFVILVEIVVHDAEFGGFSSGGKPSTFEDGAIFIKRALPVAAAGQTNPPAAGAGYLKGLLDLQAEMEARIGNNIGQSTSDIVTSKSDLASVLFKRGDFGAAEKLYREVWEARERTLGPDHSDTLLSKENVANAVLWLGDRASAEQLYREVWETRKSLFGPQHPDTLSTQFRLERCTEKIV